MGSEGSKELMRGAVAVVVGVKTQHNRGEKSGRRGREEKDGGEQREKCCCQQNQMARSELLKIQLKCGVKTGFEVGHGA
ncbi:Sperm motility kinase Tcr mutant form [Dissostichus eleginoides]|nr:Sperm motility kinase Tcr mutant form [Dissostichus eleginoides]